MRFLVDADLPRSTVTLLRHFGHVADDVRDIGLGRSPDREIALHARSESACLLTGDFGFADIRAYPPEQYHGLVVFRFPSHATAPTILRLIETLLHQHELLEQLQGHLAIVEFGRVRLRPA